MKIGFIGFGEAAFNIALGLGSEGITDIVAYDVMMQDVTMGKLVRSRAKEAKVELIHDARALAKRVDVIFAAVPSSFALDVCSEIENEINSDKLYVDVSASTPTVKQQIWETVRGTGVQFVDAAMLGSLPKDKHKVPITASGNGAKQFHDMMTPFGMKITLAGDKAGAASAIKLVRSVFMKGVAALMIEMLQASDAYGVSDEVIASVGESMDESSFTSNLDRLVTGSAIHCQRRAAELKGSITMLEDKGIGAEMTVATKRKLENLVPYKFAERYVTHKPAGWPEIIDILKAK
jgi:3-hydroxyisobutyrate dehydrogenase-like beta-hydroxyacid dehydrogenase